MKNDDLGSQSTGEPKWRFKTFFADLPADLEAKFKILHTEIIKNNSGINIIPGKSEIDSDYMHLADCYLAVKGIIAKDKSKTIYDILGSNGLPGIFLAALDPSRKVVVMDSDGRKMEFIKSVASQMGLSNLQANIGRVEDLAENTIESAIIRGNLPITKSLLFLRKYVSQNGVLYHMKGNTWAREVGDIPSQICSHWKPELCCEYQLPISGARMAVVSTIKR